ncbi:MAG: hypothetical protein KBT34_12505 [Prevotella sp.]|nr:hypothetical protein [Candidatus Prevotella equi]
MKKVLIIAFLLLNLLPQVIDDECFHASAQRMTPENYNPNSLWNLADKNGGVYTWNNYSGNDYNPFYDDGYWDDYMKDIFNSSWTGTSSLESSIYSYATSYGINYGSNGSFYFGNGDGRIFYGNQYVKVTSLSNSNILNILDKANWGIQVGTVVLGITYDLYQNNGSWNSNCTTDAINGVCGIVGGVAGVKIGAYLGSFVNVPWGTLIGGAVGGVLGSVGGSNMTGFLFTIGIDF